MSSCPCSQDNSSQKEKVLLVHCPIKFKGINSTDNIFIPFKSHMWQQLHTSVCNLENRVGVSLPSWTTQFYRESFPSKKCVGEMCNIYL